MEQKWESEYDEKNSILFLKFTYAEKGVLKEKEMVFFLDPDKAMLKLVTGTIDAIAEKLTVKESTNNKQ